jgi:hypothetical protein
MMPAPRPDNGLWRGVAVAMPFGVLAWIGIIATFRWALS